MLTKENLEEVQKGKEIYVNVFGQPVATQRYLNSLNLIPGRFNPLHRSHKLLHSFSKSQEACFELSICNRDKGNLSLEEVNETLEQFLGYSPVLVTNAKRFEEKLKIARKYAHCVDFSIGMDTLHRLIEDEGIEKIEKMDCLFDIFPRFGFNPPEKIPLNCFLYEGYIPEFFTKISSTELRNKK